MSATSSDDGSGPEDEPQVESLVSGRERRSNAGNRMATLLATEETVDDTNEEDDDLKLLFEENAEEEDAEFASGDDAVSDVEMDSSSDDDDGKDDEGEFAGEKEIERQAKEEKKRKRRALEAFGVNKKRKTTDTKASVGTKQAAITSLPEPRPKKKSERVSWLPTQEEGPIRASSRKQTMQNRVVTHERMQESEKRREQVLKLMAAAAKKKEAERQEPLSQKDRLAEAARVEAENAKTLNRWDARERLRVEEQRAKLAALKNRTAQESVICTWSGQSQWVDGQCIAIGGIAVEDKKKAEGKKGTALVHQKAKAGGTIVVHDPPPRVAPSSASVPPAITLATTTILQDGTGRWNTTMPGNPFHDHSGESHAVPLQISADTTRVPRKVVVESLTLIALDEAALEEASMQDSVLIKGRRSAIKLHGKQPDKEKCLITGLHARYRDPRTGVPYENIAAFKQLRINEAVGAYTNGRWSTLLGQYVGSDSDAPNAVPMQLKGGA